MKRTPRPPRSDDPIAIAQRILDGEDEAARKSNRQSSHLRPVPSAPRSASGFPACPDGTSARTWSLTEHWLGLAEGFGIYRPVSPWQFAERLKATIEADPVVMRFLAQHGHDVVEDLLRRMVEIFWRDFVAPSATRHQVMYLFLEDDWSALWDAAKTQVQTDRIKAQLAAGEPLAVQLRTVQGSLLNDPDYQAKLAALRVAQHLRRHPPGDPDDPTRPSRTPAEIKQMLTQLSQRLHDGKSKRLAEADSNDVSESLQEVGHDGPGDGRRSAH